MQKGVAAEMAQPEPWLRGTYPELDPVLRQFVHSMEQAGEDLERWCSPLSDAEVNARPMDLPAVAFHLRHIARSLDRLLSYAEGRQLDEAQKEAMRAEMEAGATVPELFAELHHAMENAKCRAAALLPQTYGVERGVGRKRLPTTVGGLIVHCAEHMQRHVGQAIMTAKVLAALRANR